MILLLAVVLAGCADSSSLAEDTAFRRVVEGFATYDQCIAEGDPSTPCYQTLTLCSNGNVLLDLENHQEEGSYELDGDTAIATFIRSTVVFDLATASSTQLPGKPWERVQATFYGCDLPE